MIATVRHARRGRGIGDEDRLRRALCGSDQLHDSGVEMHSVRDEVSAQPAVRQHCTEDAGCTMIQRTHRVECMRRMPRTVVDAALSGRKIGVRMTETHANAAPRCFSDHFRRTFQFRSDCHHPKMTARSLPKTIESLHLRRQQIRCRMHALASMTDERPFKVNAEWTSAVFSTVADSTATLDSISQTFQRSQC